MYAGIGMVYDPVKDKFLTHNRSEPLSATTTEAFKQADETLKNLNLLIF